jgi:hypothetical protein
MRFAVVFLVIGAVGRQGCGGGDACEFEGVTYSSGEHFTFRCFDAAQEWTECVCQGDGTVTCTVKPGTLMPNMGCPSGEQWIETGKTRFVYSVCYQNPLPSTCNACTCQSDGSLVCGPSTTKCQVDCLWDGGVHHPYETLPKDCNTCSFDEDCNFSCTQMGCPDGGADANHQG